MKRKINGNWYRVVEEGNIWTDQRYFYPEERWMLLYWRMGSEYQIFFKKEEDAWKFLEEYANQPISTEESS